MACGLAQLFGAEGVEVAGDGAGDKFEVGVEERAVEVGGVPTEVEGGVPHRIVGGEAVRVRFDDGGEPPCAEDIFAPGNPGVAGLVSGAFLGEIEVGESEEAVFFRSDGIVDHPLDDLRGRAVEPGDEEGGWGLEGGEGEVLFEVGIFEWAFDGKFGGSEEGEFGIDAGLVAFASGCGAVFSVIAGGAGDADGDTEDGGEDADGAIG